MNRKYNFKPFRTTYDNQSLFNSFNQNEKNLYDFVFNFYNERNMKNKFEILDEFSNLNKIKLSSFEMYINIKKELKKRNANILEKDYNKLFITNVLILKKYLKIFHTFNNLEKVLYISDFNVPNINKPKNKVIKLNIKDFNSKNIQEKFEVIFDKIILENIFLNKDRYIDFCSQNRINFNIKENKIPTQKYIDSLKAEKLTSNIDFKIKKFRYTKRINIYIDDVNFYEFNILFDIISCLFKNKEFKIFRKKDFDEFNIKNSKKILSLFLFHSNENINKLFWTNDNKYILSFENLEKDLNFLFTKNIVKNLSILKSNEKDKESLRSIYNSNYYVSKRVNEFINLFNLRR